VTEQTRGIRLDNGRVIKLPAAPDVREFELAGNVLAFACGIVIAFDPVTGTIATHTKGTWWLQQPATREQFERHCRNVAETVAAGIDAPPGPVH
jgi:hypothetical protein